VNVLLPNKNIRSTEAVFRLLAANGMLITTYGSTIIKTDYSFTLKKINSFHFADVAQPLLGADLKKRNK